MFNKDILIVDLETTGLDSHKHEIIQIAGILLEKKSLKEKKSFNSYVKPQNWSRRDPISMEINKIDLKTLKKAGSLKTVLSNFQKAFPKNILLANYGGTLDVEFLKSAYRQINKTYPFEYHTFNIWPLAYTYSAMHKLLKNKKRFTGFSLDDLMAHFKIKIEGRHDALFDCRAEAEVMRKIIKSLTEKV